MTWDEFIDDAETSKIEDLEKLHTKQLLSKLFGVRARMGRIEYDSFFDLSENKSWNILNKYKKLIKQVLSTREHVPNKVEARKIRQEKARKK